MEFISSEIEVSRTTISGKRFVIILSIILSNLSYEFPRRSCIKVGKTPIINITVTSIKQITISCLEKSIIDFRFHYT